MPTASRRPERDRHRLNDYWNAVARGAPPEELARLADGLDPSVRTAIDRAHALHRRRRPDPAFATRLERTLMDAFATSSAGTVPVRPAQAGPTNGRFAAAPATRPWPRLNVPPERRRWLAAQLATAALLLVTFVGIILVFNRSDQPAVAPPNQVVPGATPTGDWTTFKGDAARRGEADAGPQGDPVELWRVQAGGPCLPSPAAVAGVVYAACSDGVLYALDAATGEERWRFAAPRPLADGPAVAGDLVYVVDNEGALYAVAVATGAERWRFAGPVHLSPAVADGLLAIGAPDGTLVGLDAAAGTERWRFAVTDRGAVRSPAIAGGIVYAGSEAGGIVAVDAANGEERWRADTDGFSTGTAVVADGIAYIGASADAGEGRLVAFDAESGEQLWVRDEPIFTPAVSNGVGYSGSDSGTVYAFETATGEELWRTQVGGTARPLAVAGGIVYVPSDGDRAIYALATENGAQLWRFALDGGIDASIAVAGGALYVNTILGSIYAIGGAGDLPLAAPLTEASPEAAQEAIASPVASADASPAAAAVLVEFVWGTPGGSQPFDQPANVTIAPDGRLWVADGSHSLFQIFEPDGTFVEAWGRPGNGDGEFDFVAANGDGIGGVAFAPDGSFYVIDTGNLRIQHFDEDRGFVRAWGGFGEGDGQFIYPLDIAVDAAGDVFVNDFLRNNIQKFDGDGRFLLAFGEPGSDDGQMQDQGFFALDAKGNVWVPDRGNRRLQVWTNDGQFLTAWPGEGEFERPLAVAIDASGRVFVGDEMINRIVVLDAVGDVLTSWGGTGTEPGQFIVPAGLALDGQGHAYVVDIVGGRLQKFRLLPPLAPEATPTA